MRHILVVANRVGRDTRAAGGDQAALGGRRLRHLAADPRRAGRPAGDWTLRYAVKLISRSTGAPVRGLRSRRDAYDAVADALSMDDYDEVVISTLPRAHSRWLHRSLPRKVARLGVPVSVVTPEGEPLMHV